MNGMDVLVIFKDGAEVVYRNVTEIHYNFDSAFDHPFGVQIAIESDTHCKGINIPFSKIREFEATVALEESEAFSDV